MKPCKLYKLFVMPHFRNPNDVSNDIHSALLKKKQPKSEI